MLKAKLRRLLVSFLFLSLFTVTNVFAGSLPAHPDAPNDATTERVSVSSDGFEGDERSTSPSISSDGRFVAFQSSSHNLVSGDTNNYWDIFVRDRLLGTTELVSVSSDETLGNGISWDPSISSDGRFVAFFSGASNLVSGDTNNNGDIFVRDRLLGTNELVSISSNGSQTDDGSSLPYISPDGRFVVFESWATNLVDGDTNDYEDVFLRDRQAGTTERISVASDGTQGNDQSYWSAISADGRFVVFASWATNLVDGDTNGYQDVFVRDRQAGTTELISKAWDGSQGDDESDYPSISSDGRYVAFHSDASNLGSGDTNGARDVFFYDRQAGTIELVSIASDGTQGNDLSDFPSISSDGRYVTFQSKATNLVSGDTNGYGDVFVVDRQSGTIELVSIASDGTQGDDDSYNSTIPSDGRYIAFVSEASNLVDGDTNGYIDIFGRDRAASSSASIVFIPCVR